MLAVGAGLLMFAAWPRAGIPWLVIPGWVLLLTLSGRYVSPQSSQKAFFGYVYGAFLLFNLFTTYWIWFATPAGAVLAITVNALLMTLTFWIWHQARRRLPLSMYAVLFPVIWISFEKLHYQWDLEWPWLTMGNVFASHPAVVQWYEWTGVLGGSLWILIAAWWLYRLQTRSFKPRSALIKWALWILLPVGWSVYRYYTYEPSGKEAKVIIMQPNIDPWTEKFDRPNTDMLDDLIDLLPRKDFQADLILAPETALPQGMEIDRLESYPEIRRLKELAQRYHTPVLTGVSLYHIVDTLHEKIPPTANYSRRSHLWYQLYNSALWIDPDGRLALYHKAILVPGAEKMPYRKIFKPLLGDIVLDLGGMAGTHTPSPEPVVFSWPGTPVKAAPIICYESIFGDYVRQYVLKGANLLTVISNDGWWKKTSGYRQHYDYARLRAIENRRDVLRSANTGQSGHIDQTGRSIQSLPYNRRGILTVYPRLNDQTTFYTQHGDYIARVSIFLTILLLLYALLGRKKGGYPLK